MISAGTGGINKTLVKNYTLINRGLLDDFVTDFYLKDEKSIVHNDHS